MPRGKERKLIVIPYVGCAHGSKALLLGRVASERGAQVLARKAGLATAGTIRSLSEAAQRALVSGRRGLVVRCRGGEVRGSTTTDGAGCFRLPAELSTPGTLADAPEALVEVEVMEGRRLATRAPLPVASTKPNAKRLFISDIDDTVIVTKVRRRLRMVWRNLVRVPAEREMVPGWIDAYRALTAGPGGNEQNPFLFVSRAPWSSHTELSAALVRAGVPPEPCVILRDWGLTRSHPLPRRGRGYKATILREVLAVHDGLPAVLLGDSGQSDPETFGRVATEFPGRVAAIFIRNVSGRSRSRRAEIDALASRVAEVGTSFFLHEDSEELVREAVRLGLAKGA